MPVLEATPVKRVFMYKNDRIPDPDPLMTPEEVIETLSVTKPEFACGFVKERIINEEDETEMLYKIDTNVGTKG